MFTEFKHTLRRLRGSIIGWGIGIFSYGLLMASFYSAMQGMEDFTELLENYPQEMLAFFPSISEIMTPQGYMDTYYFAYMTLIIGIFSVAAGGNLLVADEEKGILDLLIAYPVSRSGFFLGRLAGYLVATAVILIISWLGWLIPSGSSGLGLDAVQLLRPFLPLYVILVLFGMFALLLSMLLPSARSAAGLSGAMLVINFLLVGLSNINPELQEIYELTPLYFYQGGSAVVGVDWVSILFLSDLAMILVLLAWWLFTRREIRVGGEGGWKLPNLGFNIRRI
jgi:ABC-2 type transport system permease protein